MRGITLAATRSLALGTAAAACGIPSPSVSSTTGAETDGDVPTLPAVGIGDGEVDGDDDDDDDDDDDQQSRCQAEIAVLAPWVTHPEGGCSVILRLHPETQQVLAYQSLCAQYHDLWLDEPQARDLTQCCSSAGTALNPPDDQDLWVFYQEPAPAGALAVVSTHVAARLLEGTIVWNGMGELVDPDAWLEPEGLGTDCGMLPMPEIDSYDLVSGGPIASDDLAEAWAAVSSTAVPHAMSTIGEPRRAWMILYAPSVGPLGDLSTREHLMILEGGIDRDPAPEPDRF